VLQLKKLNFSWVRCAGKKHYVIMELKQHGVVIQLIVILEKNLHAKDELELKGCIRIRARDLSVRNVNEFAA
jgi:hypothetical protein